jgi:uncharacterized protein (DUF302 family)
VFEGHRVSGGLALVNQREYGKHDDMRRLLLIFAAAFGLSGVVQAMSLEDMLVKIPVEEGISGEEVDESIRSLSVSEGIFYVFYAPLYKQVEAVTGEPYRHLSIHNICDAKIGAEMADYNDALVIMMPCRISVVEDKDGKLWLYTTNPDLIVNDPNLPPDIKAKAKKVADKLISIMEKAAAGEF